MSRVAVFDSGFGSLTIIKAIQKHTKAEIIYFADQKNFPYGKKSKKELETIIKSTIANLKKKFDPDLIIVGSNTPSLLLGKTILDNKTVLGVLPPLQEALQYTKTKSIALLVTHSVAQSAELKNFINKNRNSKIKIIKIDSSELVDLVESGQFLYKKKICTEKIIATLQKQFLMHDVDVATLSSTHLPFLLPFLKKIFPHVLFLDPAEKIADQIVNHKLFSPSTKNTLQIFSSGNITSFQKNLKKIKITNTVQKINF